MYSLPLQALALVPLTWLQLTWISCLSLRLAAGIEWSDERGKALVGVGVAFRHRQHITAEMLRRAMDGTVVAAEEGRLSATWHRSQKALLM